MTSRADARTLVAGVLVLGLGAWYLKRQVSNAAGAAWDGLTTGLGNAWSGVTSAGDAAVNAMGVGGTKDPITGLTVPYGAVPNPAPGVPYNVPWYLGGGNSSVFDASGVYGATTVRQAEQAEVRRVDNNLDATPYGAVPANYPSTQPWYLGGG